MPFLAKKFSRCFGGVSRVDSTDFPALALDDGAIQVEDDLNLEVCVALPASLHCCPPSEPAAKVLGNSRKMLQEGRVVRAGFAMLMLVLFSQFFDRARQCLAAARFLRAESSTPLLAAVT